MGPDATAGVRRGTWSLDGQWADWGFAAGTKWYQSYYRDHQEVLGRLVSTLRSWAKGRDVTVVQAPLDVRFGPDRILQPDAMVFLSALDREVSTPIDSIPELCVEVLSTHRAYDRVTKRFIYAEAGVQEYWIVDAGRGVERRDGPGLARIEVVTNELTTPLLPDLVVDVPALLGG